MPFDPITVGRTRPKQWFCKVAICRCCSHACGCCRTWTEAIDKLQWQSAAEDRSSTFLGAETLHVSGLGLDSPGKALQSACSRLESTSPSALSACLRGGVEWHLPVGDLPGRLQNVLKQHVSDVGCQTHSNTLHSDLGDDPSERKLPRQIRMPNRIRTKRAANEAASA